MDSISNRLRLLADLVGGVPTLASLLEVDPKTAYGYLDIRPCPARRLAALAEMLGLDYAWLSEGVGPAPTRGLVGVAQSALLHRVALSPPTGLRRLAKLQTQGQARLEALTRQVQEALRVAEEDPAARAALAATLPDSLLAAYRAGVAIPGPAHWQALRSLTRLGFPEAP